MAAILASLPAPAASALAGPPAASPGPQAVAPPPSNLGIQVFGMWPDPMDRVIQSGAAWIRTPLYWKEIEPQNTTPQNYQWPAALDEQLARAAAHNVHVILTLKDNPSWAAEYPSGPVDRVDISELVEFLQAAVARYSAPPYHVKHWELYNEPDNTVRWRAVNGGWAYFGHQPAEYVRLLRAVYGPLKAVDPQSQIVFGGLAYDGWESGFAQDFLDAVLQGGGGAFFDVLNFHYYPLFHERWDPYGRDIVGKATALRQKLAAYSLSKPLVCTETSMWTNAARGGSEELQTRYVVQVFVRSMAAGLEATIWFMLHDEAGPEPIGYGLLYCDLSPKPAYRAYQTLSQQLTGAGYIRELGPGETGCIDVEAYEFLSADGSTPIIAAWANDEASHDLWLATRAAAVVDRFGSSTTVADGDDGQWDGRVRVRVGPDPVYVRLDPTFALVVGATGQGKVEVIPGGAYHYGDVVTLRPIASPGWFFSGWNGRDRGDVAPCGEGIWSLTMNRDKWVSAIFADHKVHLPLLMRASR